MIDTPNLNDEFKHDALFQQASLGVEVEAFIYSDRVGIYLMQKAQQARQAAMEALCVVDPEDEKTIRELQWQQRIPDLLITWLEEAIGNGKVAEQNIQLEESGYGRR